MLHASAVALRRFVDDSGILDLVPGQRDGWIVVYQPRNGGSSTIRDFQISRGPGGQLVATVQKVLG